MENISNLTPMKKQLFYVLKDGMKRLLSDDCTDEEVAHIVGKINAESRGYYNESSFVNYDEAMRILKVKSRETLKDLLDKHKIKQQKIKNTKVGFLRSEVEKLAAKLS